MDCCDNCMYLYGSKYCLEHCPYDASKATVETRMIEKVKKIGKPLGRWIDKYGHDTCSVCGEEISDAQTFDGRPFKYCPMCGYPMDVKS